MEQYRQAEEIKSADLKMAATGKIIMQDGNLVFNFTESAPKKKKEARLETHNEFIDIQLPLSILPTMALYYCRTCT